MAITKKRSAPRAGAPRTKEPTPVATAQARPMRGCDVCNQADDHPRHVQPIRGSLPLVRHIDCCASRGCGVCQATEKVTGGVRGHELLATIQSGVLDDMTFEED